MQILKVGEYKSTVEPFTAKQMSEANRHQINSYLSCVWDTFLDEISQSRMIDCNQLNKYADSLLAFYPTEKLPKTGMVDTLCYIDEVSHIIEKRLGGDFSLINPKDLNRNTPHTQNTNANIAIYYAFGDIVDRETEWNENVIASETVCKDLKALRLDPNIKAVVIRINSGGGSAFASEQIWREVKLLNNTKPVVISMGGTAASGGYYIACAGQYIVAEPTTLTGSIGIFGIIPDASELLTEKLDLHFDVVKTNKYADFGSISRPLSTNETALMQRYIERGYQLFVERVAEGRNLSIKEVEKVAQGRVWTGKQAESNGLVDANGDIDLAIEKAAQLAQVSSYNTASYPIPAPWYTDIIEKQKKSYIYNNIKEVYGNLSIPLIQLMHIQETNQLQARIPFELNLTN